MAHIGPAVRRRRQKLNWTLQKLATLSGLDSGYLSRLENEKSGYTYETEEKLAAAMNIAVKSLHESKSNVEPIMLRHKRIPVLGWIRAGELVETPIRFAEDDYRDFIMADENFSPGTFALRVKGDSMMDRFHEGDVIIVDPTASVRPGDFVVARQESGPEAVFKKFRLVGTAGDGSDIMQLVSLNPDFPTLDSRTEQLRIIGVMMEHRIPRRR